ncbi:hypothetical protein PO124_11460 [Bacillus licheniformis]|nr:hypothetical protein [Bacillus licheniformis]
MTDCLITINEEDFVLAKACESAAHGKIHGIGVDTERFHPVSETEKCCSGKHTVSKKTTLSSYIPRS